MHTRLLHPLVLLLALLASLLTASPSRGQASALSSVIGIDRPRLSVVEQASGCDAKHDLIGTLTADDTGTVINRSSHCTYMVGLAVYQMFDENIGSQKIADWETAQLEPGARVELTVSLPDCIVQVDLFYGPVQFSLADAQYGQRILQARKLRTGRTYCQQLAPTCSAYSANVTDELNLWHLIHAPNVSTGWVPASIRSLSLVLPCIRALGYCTWCQSNWRFWTCHCSRSRPTRNHRSRFCALTCRRS